MKESRREHLEEAVKMLDKMDNQWQYGSPYYLHLKQMEAELNGEDVPDISPLKSLPKLKIYDSKTGKIE